MSSETQSELTLEWFVAAGSKLYSERLVPITLKNSDSEVPAILTLIVIWSESWIFLIVFLMGFHSDRTWAAENILMTRTV